MDRLYSGVFFLLLLFTLFSNSVSGKAVYTFGTEKDTIEDNSVRSSVNRPKIALVLCGGGAKGAAHVGVLKVLEEEGVPIDMIVGTSIGAIIGGLYSMGYNANQLDSIVSNINWDYLLSDNTLRKDASFDKKIYDAKYLLNVPFQPNFLDSKDGSSVEFIIPGGLISGQNILNLMTDLSVGYQGLIKFKDLPIPFACIVTDLATGEAKVLSDGNLPVSMRASMAIPGVFSPTNIDGNVYVDGGVVNNFPVNVAREMGADIVIGVDIQSDLAKPEELKSITQVLSQLIGLTGNEQYLKNLSDVDVLIKPDVTGYSTYSFNNDATDSLTVNGYIAGDKMRNEIRELVKKVGKRDRSNMLNAPKATDINRDTFMVKNIYYEGINEVEIQWIERISRIKESNITMSGHDINSVISLIMGTNSFESVTYRLENIPDTNEYNLFFDLRKGAANELGIGVRVDSEEVASILLHLGIRENRLMGSKGWINGEISFNPFVNIGYSYTPTRFARFSSSYTFEKRDMDIYRKNTADDNYLEFVSNKLDIGISNLYMRNFDFTAGVKFEHYNYENNNAPQPDDQDISINQDGKIYFGYYVTAKMDNRDKKHFPTRGLYIDASSNFYQTDFDEDFENFASLGLNLTGAISLGKTFALIPTLYSRLLIGPVDQAPFVNYIGGTIAGRYLSQQLPFIGLNNATFVDNSVGIARLDLRKQMWGNHYVYLQANYLRTDETLGGMLSSSAEDYIGLGLEYSYDTRVGPLSLNVFWSDYNHNVGVYASIGYAF